MRALVLFANTAAAAVPITLPAFEQFQGVLYPLRGLWNRAPAEGDRFVNAEIDWGTLGTGVSCVQFQLSGNSPVAFSQIVAMSVDNRRCGSDVEFIYPDSGFVLAIPAFNQGVYPVFTNALMFYANSPAATLGDITICQILNSMPPPVAIQPTSEQQHAGGAAIAIGTNGTTPIVPAGINGTLNGFSITLDVTTAGFGQMSLVDGAGNTIWGEQIPGAPLGITTYNLSNLNLRFINGINLVVVGAGGGLVATATVNLYYSVP